MAWRGAECCRALMVNVSVKPIPIFFDEHGWTGENLLDSDQPVFVLASSNLESAVADALMLSAFGRTTSKERKFTQIRKRLTGRNGLVSLTRQLDQHHRGQVAVFPQHKKFALFTKIADALVETFLFRRGIDFYAGGKNLLFCNAGWFCMKSTHGEDRFNHLLDSFQILMRRRSEESLDTFRTWLDQLIVQPNDPVSLHVLCLIRASVGELGLEYIQALPPQMNDLAQSGALLLMQHWRQQLAGPFHIFHDRSRSMEAMRDAWDALTRPDVPEVTVGWDERLQSFPLNVTQTEFADSVKSPGIQLCDLLAGIVGCACQADYQVGDRRDFADALVEAGALNLSVGAIWPDPTFNPPVGDTGPLGGMDPHEVLSALLERGLTRPNGRSD
jgi:hypothetical protein